MNISQIDNTISNIFLKVDFLNKTTMMSVNEIKEEFKNILNLEECKVSKETKNKWLYKVNKTNSKLQLQFMISNLILAADNLKV